MWYRNAPDGVDIIPTFIGIRSGERASFANAIERAEQLAVDLCEVGSDLVSISGTPPFLLKGLGYEREWAAVLARKTGVPIVTPMEPHVIALQAIGARRVAIASYYGDELNEAIAGYVRQLGMEPVVLPALRVGAPEGLYSAPLPVLSQISAEAVYRHCRQGLRETNAAVDALYINGGAWDAASAVDPLERDLGIPVVWALAAEMWLVYRTLGIANPITGLGSILRGEHRPAPPGS
jgi:maleate cis-trans isomerase